MKIKLSCYYLYQFRYFSTITLNLFGFFNNHSYWLFSRVNTGGWGKIFFFRLQENEVKCCLFEKKE